METKEPTMTKQELRAVENILSKAGATFGDLRTISSEDWETLTGYSFNRFLAAQPRAIKTLLEAKADGLDEIYIRDFIDELSSVNEAIEALKDNVEALRCLSLFTDAFSEASDEYGSEIYTD